jgi:hypothetical protein
MDGYKYERKQKKIVTGGGDAFLTAIFMNSSALIFSWTSMSNTSPFPA